MKLPKYRAWDHDDKKMWKVVTMSESIYGDCEDSYIKVCEFDKSPMDKETDIRLSFNFDLMQFTGLYDKNGKEIYEGDIVRIKGHALQRDKRGIGIDIDGNYVVKWSEKMELILAPSPESKEGWLLSKNLHYIEVIGNIYENPELEESK